MLHRLSNELNHLYKDICMYYDNEKNNDSKSSKINIYATKINNKNNNNNNNNNNNKKKQTN